MLLSLLALIGTVTFSGGNINALAKTMAEATGQNVVIFQSFTDQVKAVTFDPGDLTSMARAIRAKTGLSIAPGVELALSDGYITPERVRPITSRFPVEYVELPRTAFVDHKITFRTEKSERLNIGALARAPFGKPLTVHWIYDRSPVAIQANEMPERDFLSHLAKALGARLIDSPKEYRLDFDPLEFKKRATNRILNWPDIWIPEGDSEDYHPRQAFAMIGAIVNQMRSEDLIETFRKPDSKTTFRVNKNKAIQDAFSTSLGRQLQDDGRTVNSPRGNLDLFGIFQAQQGLEVTMTAQFSTKVRLTYHDPSLQGEGTIEVGYSPLPGS